MLLFIILLKARGRLGFLALYTPDSINAPISIYSYASSFSIGFSLPRLFPPYGKPLMFCIRILIDASSLKLEFMGRSIYLFVSVIYCPVLCIVFLINLRCPAVLSSIDWFCLFGTYAPPLYL